MCVIMYIWYILTYICGNAVIYLCWQVCMNMYVCVCVNLRISVVQVMMPLALSDADDGSNGMIWPKKSCSTLFHCLDQKNAMVSLMVLLASCDTSVSASGVTWYQPQCKWHSMILTLVPVVSHDEKGHFAIHFNYLELRNAVMPLTMLFVLYDADASAGGVTWYQQQCQWYPVMLTLASIMSHDQQIIVAPCFDCLDLWNAIVPLMMVLVSPDASVGTSGVTWQHQC